MEDLEKLLATFHAEVRQLVAEHLKQKREAIARDGARQAAAVCAELAGQAGARDVQKAIKERFKV